MRSQKMKERRLAPSILTRYCNRTDTEVASTRAKVHSKAMRILIMCQAKASLAMNTILRKMDINQTIRETSRYKACNNRET
jgi:hypothetical protein